MSHFSVGQRYMSETEPELGLGLVAEVDNRQVTIYFKASDVTRRYAMESAPVKRIRFRIGDEVKTEDGEKFIVQDVLENEGVLIYNSAEGVFPESELCSTLSFNTPEERLLGGHADDFRTFDLRYACLVHQRNAKCSRVRGFLGARIDLIGHQLYLAHEMSTRRIPRVLLADEVGLGKTIEACLILHRLLCSHQLSRVLIILPPALIHQWFVELLRRFNLSFRIFDEETCEAFTEQNPDSNPFLESQLGLVSLDFLKNSRRWQKAALDAGWDMIVVDEAHHLAWSEHNPSDEYKIVEHFALKTNGLLLLTATPEQLGFESHFARLRLLDPSRYRSFEDFVEESQNAHIEIGELCEKILEGGELSSEEISRLKELIPKSALAIREVLEAFASGDETKRASLVNRLLDQHGIGRVMFRNTRKRMTGFPKRIAHLIPLGSDQESLQNAKVLREEFENDIKPMASNALKKYDFSNDLRVKWLAKFIQEHPDEKILLITRFKEKVFALDEALQKHLNVKVGLFHEDLALIRRDRNAAWFSEKDGAQILMCSEIGSEGRNFQFAHHLVLFDLPLDQELLEQRIGRLDRIGQKEEIQIHVPFWKGSPQEFLAHWYHDGLNAFEHNAVAGCFFDERFDEPIKTLALLAKRDFKKEAALIEKTKSYANAVAKRLEAGRDRLLELHSYRPEVARSLIEEIAKVDASKILENLMELLFDHFGVKVEQMAERTYLLTGDHLFTEAFPGLKREGLQVTYSRKQALEREDIQFLSWDHPMATGAVEFMLGTEQGNSAVAVWESDEDENALLLEAVFVLESLASPELYVDRFLPSQPIRVLVNQHLEDCTDEYERETMQRELKEGKNRGLIAERDEMHVLIERMRERAEELASDRVPKILEKSLFEMREALETELGRLRDLKVLNDHVSEAEIESVVKEQAMLTEVITSARLRLDGLRAIWKAPK